MKTSLTALALTAGLALATAAPAAPRPPEEQLARLLDGRTAGKPVRCLPIGQLGRSQIVDGTAIVYRIGGRIYVNRPQSDARQVDRDDILVTRTSGSQLCRMDLVRLIDRGSRFPSGFVSLGDFVPYSRR